MPKTRLLWRSDLALLALMSMALLTGSVPLQNPHVRTVGELLTCQCGCGASITSCNMMNCHFAEPARERLLKLVEAGATDEQILAAFEKDYGKSILRQPPAQGFDLLAWVMPFAGLGAGLVLVWLVLQHYMKRRPAAATVAVGESDELKRYRERIEKELADMDTDAK